jgi:hypothetical protein
MSQSEKALVPIAVATIGAVATVAVAWLTASYTAREEVRPIQAASIGPLSEGQKLCSVFIPYQFRDSLIVPKTWSVETCRQFQSGAGATQLQVGCVFETTVTFGEFGGAPPTVNCGW